MPDFARITKRFNRGNATLEDVVRVYQAVSKVPFLILRSLAITSLLKRCA